MTPPRPGTAAPRRLPVGLTILTVAVLAVLLSLGTWQVQRLQWKRGLLDQFDAVSAAPPAPLAGVLASGEPLEFRRVILDCPGLAAAPYVELQSIRDGRMGVRLISPCTVAPVEGAPTAGAAPSTYLVDRGFVAEEVSLRPPVSSDAEPFTLTAVARVTPPPSRLTPPPTEGRFYGRDTAAMARALNLDPASVADETLFALTSTNPDWPALEPSAPPVAFSNNHLGYALTWFGLAIALVAFYAALVRRRWMRG